MAERAHALRYHHDLSIRAVAAELGVPRSTVGDWLRGTLEDGEARHQRTCPGCGEEFFTCRSHGRYCTRRCRYRASIRSTC